MAVTIFHSWAEQRRMNDLELSRLVGSGRERDSWLAMSSTLLDQHLRSIGKLSDDESAQHPFSAGLGPLHEWTDHLIQDPSDSILDPILVALASLTVGDATADPRRVMPWQTARDVNVLNQPHGFNIHLNIMQDKHYRVKYPPLYASVEAIYNIVDGVIVVRSVSEPRTPTARPGDAPEASQRLPRWRQLHEILFMAWMKLHLPVDSENVRHADYTGMLPFDDITNANDATLSQAIGLGTMLSLTELWQMLPWLNWMVINNRHDAETLQVIGRCLESRGHTKGHVPHYDRRETFRRGHWAFYALMGTEVGIHITNFLALHKDNSPVDPTLALGIKIISSITIFQPEDLDELTDRERELYADHPVLIFEIKDDAAILDLAKRHMESYWSPLQYPRGYCHIDCMRI